jgi:pSer/pThr/pTyr-binding forkhead associated (FHA) protein
VTEGALVVQAGDQALVLHETTILGRGTPLLAGDTAYLPLDDSYVSPLHARFWREDGRWHIEDLGSTNGTRVNGLRIWGPRSLGKGDKIYVGHTMLTVVPVDGTPAGAPRSGTPSELAAEIVRDWT